MDAMQQRDEIGVFLGVADSKRSTVPLSSLDYSIESDAVPMKSRLIDITKRYMIQWTNRSL